MLIMDFSKAFDKQSFQIASDLPDMSGKTEVGPAKYPKHIGPTIRSFFCSVLFFGCFFGLTK